MIIVQHLPPSFTGVLAAQLNRYAAIEIKEAEHGDRLCPGRALVAPGGLHLLVRPGLQVALRQGPPVGGHCPSIDVTMQSAAQVCGSCVKGVVLTGMGADGALGLLAIRGKGGATFAQDAESCIVAGMPLKAVEKGAADYVGSPARIADLLAQSAGTAVLH